MISKYLMEHYYSHCPQQELIPSKEQIEQAVTNHPDKYVTIQDEMGNIKGTAFFMLLTDETYSKIDKLDITQIDVIKALSLENGKNVHFLICATDNYHSIMEMVRKVKSLVKPKTVSWWNPDFSKLHRYNIRSS